MGLRALKLEEELALKKRYTKTPNSLSLKGCYQHHSFMPVVREKLANRSDDPFSIIQDLNPENVFKPATCITPAKKIELITTMNCANSEDGSETSLEHSDMLRGMVHGFTSSRV